MAISTLTTLGIGPRSDAASIMLAKLFPRWRGDAAEPAIIAPEPSKPAPAARQLVEA